jgi:hypothetical protein
METASATQRQRLAPEQQSFYREKGYFFPVRAFWAEEAAECEGRFLVYMGKYAQRYAVCCNETGGFT